MTSDLMPRRRPGTPPSITLGAMNFGKRTDPKESDRIVRRALERGVRSFDTANSYNEGESERILGRALGRDRHGVVLATKAGLGPIPGKREGLSAGALELALDGSLERLGWTHVDLYYLHVPDRSVPIEETVAAMKGLMDSGRVRAWGVSNYASWEIYEMSLLADARAMARPAVAQMLYNAIHRQLDIEYFAFTRRHPIHTTTYNALAGGLLSGHHAFTAMPPQGSRFDRNAMYQRRYWTRTMFDRVEELRAVAASEGCSLVDLAYAWVASRPDIDSVLVGPATVEHLDQAIDAMSRVLSAGTLVRIEELGKEWLGSDTHYVR